MKMDLSNLYAAAEAGEIDLGELIGMLQTKQAEITKAEELKRKKAAEEKKKNREKAMHGIIGYIFLAYPKVPRAEAEKMADAALIGVDEICENWEQFISLAHQMECAAAAKEKNTDDAILSDFLKALR